jgi:DNA-binding NarL/FixJ family response regulator
MDRIRVLLADDDERYGRTLATFLGLHDDIEVVGVSPDGRQAVEDYGRLDPDVVVMDAYMPVMDGVQAAAAMRVADPHARVVMISAHDTAELRQRAAEAGVASFVSKQDARDLVAEIRSATKESETAGTWADEDVHVPESAVQRVPLAPSSCPVDIVVTVSVSLRGGGGRLERSNGSDRLTQTGCTVIPE